MSDYLVLDTAIITATAGLAGKTDHNGKPMVLYALHCMMQFADPDYQIAALLQDLTDQEIRDLATPEIFVHISDNCFAALQSFHNAETCEDFSIIAGNDIARRVKIEYLRALLDPRHWEGMITGGALNDKESYEYLLQYLINAENVIMRKRKEAQSLIQIS